MTSVHVLRLVGEVAGERHECYRWTFDGPTTSAAAGAFVEEVIKNSDLYRALRDGTAQWRVECACGWVSELRSSPKLLWTIALFHQLATAD